MAITPRQVRAYRRKHGCSIMDARRQLKIISARKKIKRLDYQKPFSFNEGIKDIFTILLELTLK